MPDAVVREAYSHECSSAGFWPGGGAIEYPAFYSYAYPAPDGFGSAPVQPAAAFFSKELGEFILPYAAVRAAADPQGMLLEFLQSTYAAAADLAGWDRAALECPRPPRHPAGGGVAMGRLGRGSRAGTIVRARKHSVAPGSRAQRADR